MCLYNIMYIYLTQKYINIYQVYIKKNQKNNQDCVALGMVCPWVVGLCVPFFC